MSAAPDRVGPLVSEERIAAIARQAAYEAGTLLTSEEVAIVAIRQAIREAGEAAAKVCESEHLYESTDDPTDTAYDKAIDHCAAEIRRRLG